MAQSKPALYSYFRSSCSWRVRIALMHKGIDYEYKGVNLLKGEQLAEDFKKINPLASVPALIQNGNIISTSAAILEYLEETVPSPSLLPKDSISRAQVRAICDGIVSGIQPLQNVKVLNYVGQNTEKWAQHWIETGFDAIEKMLESTHGKYCFGDDVTLADVCLVPQVFNATIRFNVDLTKFPLINEISTRLSDLKAFKDSHPYVMPDCPENLKSAK